MAKVMFTYKAGKGKRDPRAEYVDHCELSMEEKTLVVRDIFNEPLAVISEKRSVVAFLDGEDVELSDDTKIKLLNKDWRGF